MRCHGNHHLDLSNRHLTRVMALNLFLKFLQFKAGFALLCPVFKTDKQRK